MLKSIAMTLFAVALGVGGGLALTLTHDRKQERLAEADAAMAPATASLWSDPAVSGLLAPALPEARAATAVAPDLPRLRPLPRPAGDTASGDAPLGLPAPQPAPPRLSASSQNSADPLWLLPRASGPLIAPMAPQQAPSGLRQAHGGINFNPWNTGVYR